MPSEDLVADREIWIGLVTIVPMPDCELLTHDKGAFVNILTYASDEEEYRVKVKHAMAYYRLCVTAIEELRCVAEGGLSDEGLIQIAKELKEAPPHHVRFGTFHTFPRAM